MKDVLFKIGLTDNESKIYLGFISNPLITTAELARELNMDKSSAYKAATSLRKKNLLIPVGGEKGLLFKAASPENLLQLYEEKKVDLEVSKVSLDSFIQKLLDDSPKSRNTNVTIDYGLDGHEKRMWESLNTTSGYIKELFRSHTHFDNNEHIEFVYKYAKERVKRNIRMRQLVEKGVHSDSKLSEVMSKRRKFNKEVRIIPEEFSNNNSFRIWGETVNIISYENQSEFITVTIKDKFIVSLIEDMWDFLWKRSRLY